jgi:hypothetical protein
VGVSEPWCTSRTRGCETHTSNNVRACNQERLA